MTMSINTGYTNSYSVSTTAANKINGRQQTVMTANFADMLNANMATSAKSATTATTSTDKVTLSTPVTQATVQDDIETEAQAIVKKYRENPEVNMYPDSFPLGFAMSGNMTPNNQKMMGGLQKELDSMFGTSQMNSPRFKEVKGMLATLASWGDKQDFNEESLTKQMQIHFRALQMLNPTGTNTAWELL